MNTSTADKLKSVFTDLTAQPTPADVELNKLASEIRIGHQNVVNASAGAVLKAIEVGTKLNEAKKKVAHGEWMTWVKTKCAISHRTANLYMELADGGEKIKKQLDEEKTKLATVANLTLRQAKAWLAKDEEKGTNDNGAGNDAQSGVAADPQNTDKDNADKAYGNAQKTLLKKLEKIEKLDLGDAENVVKSTIDALNAKLVSIQVAIHNKQQQLKKAA